MKYKGLSIMVWMILLVLSNSCKNCADYEIPYEVTEPYTDIISIPKQLTYTVLESKYQRHMGDHESNLPVVEVWTYLKNTSEYGGTFQVKEVVYTARPRKIEFVENKYIGPGQTVKFYHTKYLEHCVDKLV